MKRIFSVFMLLAALLTLCSCRRIDDARLAAAFAWTAEFDYADASRRISAASGLAVTEEFLRDLGEEKAQFLVNSVKDNTFTDTTWRKATGFTRNVISDILNGNLNSDNIFDFGNNGTDSFTVSFVGDILLDHRYAPMVHAASKGGVLGECIDSRIVDHLKASDIFLINHEFSTGSRGAPLKNKSWTFQAPASDLDILKNMGADIVSLANNHVFDYGEEGFNDTLDNLKNAAIPYIGAGRNLDEAKRPCYFIINGCKVGIVAASRAEKVSFTPVATENSPGVMGTYDNTDFLEVIRNAKADCDLLFVYVHWGTENSTVLEKAQTDGAREYIDAGADAVVGAHTHCLQGMEFYKDKPVIYSVGNFWFNSKTLDSCVMTFTVDGDMNVTTQLLPLKQKGCETTLLSEKEDARALFDRVEAFEPQGVKISDDGIVTPKNQGE